MTISISGDRCHVVCECGYDETLPVRSDLPPQRMRPHQLLPDIERRLEALGWLVDDDYLCPVCHDQREQLAS